MFLTELIVCNSCLYSFSVNRLINHLFKLYSFLFLSGLGMVEI